MSNLNKRKIQEKIKNALKKTPLGIVSQKVMDKAQKEIETANQKKALYRDEAWEYFKKRNNLPQSTARLWFEMNSKDTDLKELWGAFRHTYTSAAFTKDYGASKAKLAGDANEIIQFGSVKYKENQGEYKPGNEPSDRRMDLKNNAAGRKIAKKNIGVNLIDEVYYNLRRNPDIVLNQYKNNDEPYIDDDPVMNLIWHAADEMYYRTNKEKDSQQNEKNNNKNLILEGAVSYDNFSPDKKSKNSKHVTLEELKAPQEARKQKVHDMIQNAYKKKSLSSGEVYVREYTRDDGTKVRSYYRKRPV